VVHAIKVEFEEVVEHCRQLAALSGGVQLAEVNEVALVAVRHTQD